MAKIKAVDVSRWQGKMNWAKAASNGVKFAFIKCSEGVSYQDPYFKDNVAGCMENGIPFAYYHFWTDAAAPGAQYDNIERCLQVYAAPVAIDVEMFPNGYSKDKNATLLAQLVNELKQHTGVNPTIYTSQYKWNTHIGANPVWSSLPLWVANYNVEAPALPRDWGYWYAWQYTSQGNGEQYGAESTYIDLNMVKENYLEYYGLLPSQQEVVQVLPEVISELTINGVRYTGNMIRDE